MSSNGVMCDICGFVLCNRDGLTRHKTNMHGRKKVLENRTRCQECSLTLYKIDRLRSHLLTVHNMEMDFENRAFLTLEDFYMWKVSYERQNNCSYVAKKKNCSRNDFLYLYDCSRSGVYKDKKTVAKRSFKSQGTKKIGLNCTSTIKVTMIEGIYCVRFCKTHYGHTTEIEHCNISLIDKQQIVDMLLDGLTVDQVLEKYKCSEEVERMHLLKRKDVKNIAATYNISVENKLKQKKPQNDELEEIAEMEQLAEGEGVAETEEMAESGELAEAEEIVETHNVIIITEDGTTHTYCKLEDFPEHTIVTPEFFITNLT